MSIGTSFAQKEPSFTYRETYFPLVNNTENFHEKYLTQSLDNYWGLWGHNLPKWIDCEEEVDEDIYALVNGKRNKDQFCFSSKDLKKIIEQNIEIKKEDHKHFMISPNDNTLVCLCDKCKKIGNTSTSATPAVFYLLNELADDYKNINFFTTAYLTTKEPPAKQQIENIGVFYSTINFQQGKLYEALPNKKELIKDLNDWSSKVNQLYVWEYALNYDNYFDFYPNLFTLQENLKFLKKYHVNGVFINGSESYSVLQDIKSAVSARLLYNVNTNLENTIVEEFENRYPPKIASIASKFYLAISESFFKTKSEIGIYANINSAKYKYLTPKILFNFQEDLEELSTNLLHENTLKLRLAITFMKLEYMRTHCNNEFGYFKKNENEIIIKPEVFELLTELEKLTQLTNIKTYNEQGFTIDDYIKNWRKEILNQDKINLFLNLDFEVISNLDQGYDDKSILNDACYGFLDYNNNWLINSIDHLELKISTSKLKDLNCKKIKFGFLNDPAHQIYFPEEIILTSGNKNITYHLAKSENLEKTQIEIPLDFDLTEKLIVKIKRLDLGKERSQIATDEIIIN